MYKLRHVKFFYNIASDDTPYLIQNLVTWRESPYNLTGNNKVVVPRFPTNFMEHSMQYTGVVLSNFLSDHFNNLSKVKRDPVFKEFNFNSLLVQSVL